MTLGSPRKRPTARSLFGRQEAERRRRRSQVAVLREFYGDPISWVGLVVCAITLTYGGGAVMFWFHAIYLGEGGPAVSPWVHWLLDSSFGFVGLTPAIALILPVAARVATATYGADPANGRVRAMPFAVVAGCLLALVVGPAPMFHDAFVSQGTPLADQVTELWGNGSAPTGEPYEAPMFIEIVQQVGIGVPTYILLTMLAVVVARCLSALGFPRAVRPSSEPSARSG